MDPLHNHSVHSNNFDNQSPPTTLGKLQSRLQTLIELYETNQNNKDWNYAQADLQTVAGLIEKLPDDIKKRSAFKQLLPSSTGVGSIINAATYSAYFRSAFNEINVLKLQFLNPGRININVNQKLVNPEQSGKKVILTIHERIEAISGLTPEKVNAIGELSKNPENN